MAKKISNESFVESNFGQPVIDALKEIIALNEKLSDQLKEVGKQSAKALEGLKPSESVKDAQILAQETEKLLKVKKELDKIEQQQEKTQKKLKQVTEDQVKAQIQQRQERTRQRKAIEASLTLQQKEIKTIGDLRQQNKALKFAIEQISDVTGEGAEEFEKLTNELLDNEQQIKSVNNAIKEERKQRQLIQSALEAENNTRSNNIKTVKEAEEANKALRLAVKQLNTETQGERIADLNNLIDQNSQIIRENADETKKQKLNIGNYTEAINEALGENEEYAKTLKAINILTAISTKLFGEQEEATEKQTKATEELTEANEDLEESTQKVNRSLSASVIGTIITGLTAILGLFSQTSEGGEKIAVLFAQIGVIIQFAFERGKAAALVAVDTIQKGVSNLQVSFLTLQDSITGAFSVLGGEASDNSEKIAELNKEIEQYNENIEKNSTRVTADFTDTLKEQLSAIESIVLAEKALQKELLNTQKESARLRGEVEVLNNLRDSEAISLERRVELGEQALRVGTRLAEVEVRSAREQLRITEARIENQLKAAGILNVTADQIRNITENEELRRRVNFDLLQQQTDSLVELTEKENELNQVRLDGLEQLSLVSLDRFDRDIDDLIDFTERVIASNERIFNSDTSVFDARIKALEEIEETAEEAFVKQIRRAEEEEKAAIRTEIEKLKVAGDTTGEIQRLEQRLANFRIDENKILQSANAEEFSQQIRNLETAERVENRLLEIFRERRTFIDEQIEREEELRKKQFEQIDVQTELSLLEEERARLAELRRRESEIAAIQDLDERKKAIEEFNKEIEQIEEETEQKRLEKEIENLEAQIEARKKAGQEGSEIVLDLETQLAQKQIELNKQKLEQQQDDTQKALDKETKSVEDAEKKRADFIKTSSSLLTSFLEKQGEERLAAIDEQLSAIQERQSSLRAAAERGNEDAVKSLAESEKKEAEIRAEKERELKRQQRIEAGLAAFQVFAANAEEDPNTALSKTLTDVTALTAFLSTLPSFFVGTEDTGKVSSGLDGNGGRLAILHDNERVMTAEQNKQLGGMSNEELTKLAVDSRRGTFKTFENISSIGPSIVVNQQNESIKSEINRLIKAVEKNRPVDPAYFFDKTTGEITAFIDQGTKRERVGKKIFEPKRRK